MLQIPLLPINYLHEGAHFAMTKLLGHKTNMKSPYSFSILSELSEIADKKTNYSLSRIQKLHGDNKDVGRWSHIATFDKGTPVYHIILYSLAPTIFYFPLFILMFLMLDITLVTGIIMFYIGLSSIPSKDDFVKLDKYVKLYLEKR